MSENSEPDPQEKFRWVVCKAWEKEANKAADYGIRVINLRLGNVLDPSGGYLGKIMPLYRKGFCFILGDPFAKISWIAMEDAIALIQFAIVNSAIKGALNLTAPNPVTQGEFAERMAEIMNRKIKGTIPLWLVKLGLGSFSSTLLDSQDIRPSKALGQRFSFAYPNLKKWLVKCISEK